MRSNLSLSAGIKRLLQPGKAGMSVTARAARGRGNALRDAHQWSKAAIAYQDYLSERPTDAPLWVQLGHMLREDGQLDGSRKAYEAALAITPGDPDANFYYGVLLKRINDLAGAAHAFRQSLQSDGNVHARRELDALEREHAERAGEAWGGHANTGDSHQAVIHPEGQADIRTGRSVGTIDHVAGVEISGWAIEPDAFGKAAEIEFRTGNRIIGSTVSNRFRADIAMLGLGTTTAGFSTTLDLDPRDRRIVSVRAYLKSSGEELERSPFETTGFSPLRGHNDGDQVTTARFATAKAFVWRDRPETALFVSHSPDGVLKPHVQPYLEALRENGIDVLLVVVADRPVRLSTAQLDLVAGAIVRENVGYDFAAWAHGLRLHPELYRSEILYFINDSMFGPNSPAAFGAMLRRVRQSDANFVGLTESHEYGWHIQSYFMAFKQAALACVAVQNFFGTMVNLADKQAVIDNFEIRLASLVEANGLRAEALFSSNDPRNATLFAWRELIKNEFPFVKTLLFREQSPLFDIADWEAYLEQAGFDVCLLHDTLKHRGITGEVQLGFPLLAMPADDRIDPRIPLKVAFYGPWNYDNGLGFGSRGLIAAIRTTGVRLNLHPIRKPFHIHRPLAPAHDILDFEGPADIAIVNLNPDSWGLLTDGQRQDVMAAKKRIGHWVWEMAHIPPAWWHDFASVDRIWAPSGYCAALFEAQEQAPVDVVPYGVPLPEPGLTSTGRTALLASLGLPAGRRIILYVFDGSSYLVRKNPHALVRAFALSGLAGQGWTLVLKTKHLMDRPEEGKAFATLANGFADVVLIDRSLPQNELRDLFAAADIYASPHCSEGFGLTIAEAMGAGKSVVATDFGGSTDFLDVDCGYPVQASLYQLTEDFGHYTKGGEWALIDESALADALIRAAGAIVTGDRRVGEAARRRISDHLSYQSVGTRIAASFAAIFEKTPPRWRNPAPLDTKLLAGCGLDSADLGANVAVLPLRAGGLIPAVSDELERVPAQPDHWLMIAPADAKIDPHFRSVFRAFAAERPDVAIFYADDVAAGEDGLGAQLRLKPEFDFTLFSAQDYIGVPLLVRGSALHALGGLRHDLGEAALTDLVLRAWAGGHSIARVPFVLLGHPGKRPTVPAEARRALFAAHPALSGHEVLPGLTPDTLRLARRRDDDTLPPVTLLVPTRRSASADGTVYIERLLDSLALTDWPMDRLHVLIADDVPGTPGWATKSRPFMVRRIETPREPDEPFNYAAKMNTLWRAAETDHFVMLNDDVEARDGGWLRALMDFAVGEDVGAVGPLLMYENGSIQHAGVVGGLFGVCAHAWLYRRSVKGTYQDWALTHREWSMITGAVVATRRSMMERVNGFDERFALEFNDIDLCLRLRATGARIVYTPHARMTHAEKASRGLTVPPPEDIALFLRRWKDWLADDPAFHPKMDHHRFDLQPGYKPEDWFVH